MSIPWASHGLSGGRRFGGGRGGVHGHSKVEGQRVCFFPIAAAGRVVSSGKAKHFYYPK